VFEDDEDKYPHEPPMPDEDLPEPEDPDLGPPVPSVRDYSRTDAKLKKEVYLLFWWLVLVFNAGLFLVAVGAMLYVFRDQHAFGGQLVAAGVVLLGYGTYRYRRFATEWADTSFTRESASGDSNPKE
jgi:hypothetical protein